MIVGSVGNYVPKPLYEALSVPPRSWGRGAPPGTGEAAPAGPGHIRGGPPRSVRLPCNPRPPLAVTNSGPPRAHSHTPACPVFGAGVSDPTIYRCEPMSSSVP